MFAIESRGLPLRALQASVSCVPLEVPLKCLGVFFPVGKPSLQPSQAKSQIAGVAMAYKEAQGPTSDPSTLHMPVWYAQRKDIVAYQH